jgi:hypothetical protein
MGAMIKRILCIAALVACTRSSQGTAGTGSSAPASCDALGARCSQEGATCAPSPIGSGWSHTLVCSSGKWTELEIAPLPQGKAPPTPRALPKLEKMCKTNADCIVTTDEVEDDPPRTFACCPGCTQRAGSARWEKSFEAACAASPPPMCPPISCAMSALTPVCRLNVCELAGR